jgi:hypothetical protein
MQPFAQVKLDVRHSCVEFQLNLYVQLIGNCLSGPKCKLLFESMLEGPLYDDIIGWNTVVQFVGILLYNLLE